MRVIYARVPPDASDAVFGYLDDEDVDYVVLVEGGESSAAVVQFPLPTPAVEKVLADLNAAGIENEYTVVTSAETVETETFESLEERYTQEEEKDIAPAELRTRALEMGQRSAIYYTMTLVSATVAAAGLLLDAPAIVVGSMVIAPQVGSALKTSVGTVFDDRKMIREGLGAQVLGLSLAVVGAAAFGLVVQWLGIGPPALPSLVLDQLHQRVSPGVMSVVVAVGAGVAAALSLATAVPTSLVGVMIAAALIPAAAAVGIGIAWGESSIAAGAAVLLAVNTAAINLTGVGGLWALGYRPGDDSRRDTRSRGSPMSLRPALVAVLVLVLAVGGFGYLTLQHVAFERTASEAVEDVLSEPRYDRLTLVSLEARFSPTAVLNGGDRVSVVVTRPAGQQYPDLARRLQRRVSARVGRPVTVAVTFRDTETARPPPSRQGPAVRTSVAPANLD